MVATKGGASQRRFRVQTTAPWTTVTAEVTGATQDAFVQWLFDLKYQ